MAKLSKYLLSAQDPADPTKKVQESGARSLKHAAESAASFIKKHASPSLKIKYDVPRQTFFTRTEASAIFETRIGSGGIFEVTSLDKLTRDEVSEFERCVLEELDGMPFRKTWEHQTVISTSP